MIKPVRLLTTYILHWSAFLSRRHWSKCKLLVWILFTKKLEFWIFLFPWKYFKRPNRGTHLQFREFFNKRYLISRSKFCCSIQREKTFPEKSFLSMDNLYLFLERYDVKECRIPDTESKAQMSVRQKF